MIPLHSYPHVQQRLKLKKKVIYNCLKTVGYFLQNQ